MPRKTGQPFVNAAHRIGASMRPRPDAAENVSHRDPRRPPRPASMRPRPDAAENGQFGDARISALSGLQ